LASQRDAIHLEQVEGLDGPGNISNPIMRLLVAHLDPLSHRNAKAAEASQRRPRTPKARQPRTSNRVPPPAGVVNRYGHMSMALDVLAAATTLGGNAATELPALQIGRRIIGVAK
jgi:hypothetical protein